MNVYVGMALWNIPIHIYLRISKSFTVWSTTDWLTKPWACVVRGGKLPDKSE